MGARVNGIHEVTGSIPVWSTSLRSRIHAKAVSPERRSRGGGLPALTNIRRASARQASRFWEDCRAKSRNGEGRVHPIEKSASSKRHQRGRNLNVQTTNTECYRPAGGSATALNLLPPTCDSKAIYVYVLKNQESIPRYYVGLTSDVIARLTWHNAGRCTHTTKYRPWELHVVVQFASAQHAVQFERYLKSGSGRAFAKRHFG